MAALIIVFLLLCLALNSGTNLPASIFQHQSQDPVGEYRLRHSDPLLSFEQLRKFDPNFSQIVFEDFCYSLFALAHHARGARELDRYAPYVSEPARRLMTKHLPRGLTEVRDVIVGGILERRILEFQAEHPDFRWDDMVARITEIAIGLQDAWTARDWERVRPLETEPLFQIHRYWIEA